MDYVLRAKYIYQDQNNLVKNAELHIKDKKIVYIGAMNSPKHDLEDPVIKEFPKGLILPAFVNSHTHLPETLVRGICDDEDLHSWLFNHLWKVEPAMTGDQAKIGAQLGIAEMLASGTIAFVDQFYFADKIAEAVSETGVKAFLAPSIFEIDLFTNEVSSFEKAYNKNIEVFDTWNAHDNRIKVGFGPHAPYTVPKELFEKIIIQAKERDTKIHTHLNETERENKEALENFGCSPIEYMDKLGGLSHIVAAHCVHTSENDRRLLKEKEVTVLSNPTSNLKIGTGIAPIPDYLNRGINVCLATDGSASNNKLNMVEEARLTALIHKGIHQDPKLVPTTQILPMITSNASKIFPSPMYSGQISVGHPADLVVFDLQSVNMTPLINPLSNWLFSSHPHDVKLTMANGKILYEDGKFTTLDIDKVKQEAQEAIDDMISRVDYVPLSQR